MSGLAAATLAMAMLNKGDGNVVPQLKGLNKSCPIHFTLEAFDLSISPAMAVSKTVSILQ